MPTYHQNSLLLLLLDPLALMQEWLLSLGTMTVRVRTDGKLGVSRLNARVSK